MTVSTKGRYALRMLVDLAEKSGEGCTTMKDVAERQNISKKYLEQIVPLLTRAGILTANRGYMGGYRLAKPADGLTVGEILRATEGDLAPVQCLECSAPACERREDCATLFVWEGLKKVMDDYLNGITLQDIVDRHRGGDDYVI